MSPRTVVPRILDACETLQMPLHGARLIEASAGTGKTYAISNLYLRHVLEGRLVSAILVVTFTNAATEELRGRIRLRLHEALRLLEVAATQSALDVKDVFLAALLAWHRGLSDQERAQQCDRLRLAVRTMDEAAIFTIHGFCQRSLTDHAFNSAQPFEMQLISDDDALWQEALKDWWRRTTYPLQAHQLHLLSRILPTFSTLLVLQQGLREANGKRILPSAQGTLSEQFQRWEALLEPLQALARQWQLRQQEVQQILLASKSLSRDKKGPYAPARLADTFVVLERYFCGDTLLHIPNALSCLSARALREGSTEQGRDKDPALQDPFFLACEALIETCTDIELHVKMLVLTQSTSAARQQLEAIKTATRSLSFNDQLTRLHGALHGEQGEALTQVLRQSFPVAMIDEFQDTDALQYGIFRRLYLPTSPRAEDEALSLTMIGDPKQAIYSFRGGDIFAYAKARADVGAGLYTLDTNWRSTPAMITAVNALFQLRDAPFVYAQSIAFQPVHSAPRPHAPLRELGRETAALTLWQVGPDENGKTRGKGAAERHISAAVAQEIARLLAASRTGDVTLGERALVPGDIAVLVRSAAQGRTVREALLTCGIHAVTAGRDNVYKSEEALALALLVRGIVHCRDRTALRGALGSALLGLDYVGIERVSADQYAWLTWTQQLRELHEHWQQKGFMAMFHALLQTLQVGQTLAGMPLAERRLTNLLHLGELLQHNARTCPGQEALLSWFDEQIADPRDQEGELRLESDEALVKIVTIHASKGLEYPVVFAPFLWAATPRGKGRQEPAIAYHDAQDIPCLDFGKPLQLEALALADKERLAEDVRLAYVALTRACARVYLVWGKVSNACGDNSALAWLLHPQQSPDDLLRSPAAVSLDDASVTQALQTLVAQAPEAVALEPLPAARMHDHERLDVATPVALQAASFHGHIASDWRISSFSSLTRDVHQPAGGARSDAPSDAILQFQAGSQVGLFLHEVLENLDFQGDLDRQARELNSRFAPRYGFDADAQQDTLITWISHIVNTPLDARGLRLAAVPAGRRLNELAFDFAIDRVQVPQLNALLNEYAGEPLQPLGAEDLRGMITGVIDLVFEHDERFYIADYKSNLLGSTLADYTPERLRRAMLERRYDLQYLLYILALHRYLQHRLPGYDYARHMGGAVYLFLRALRPSRGPACGVFHDLPPVALIDRLNLLVLAAPAQEGVPC